MKEVAETEEFAFGVKFKTAYKTFGQWHKECHEIWSLISK